MDEHHPNASGIPGPRKHWLAVSSFEFGIICACCLPVLPILPLAIFLLVLIPMLSLLGFLAGVVGLAFIYRSASRYTGAIRAWIGCVLCAFAFGFAGVTFASLLNSLEGASDQRDIMQALQFYVQDNGGSLPSSLTAMGEYLPKEQLYSHNHYFYWLYTTRPYIMNGYLAGKTIQGYTHPERTLLVAVGKGKHAKLFFKRSDIDLSNNMEVTFLSLDKIERIEPGSEAIHLPADGKIAKDSWFIELQRQRSEHLSARD